MSEERYRVRVEVLGPHCVVANGTESAHEHNFLSGANRLVGAQLLVSFLLTYKPPGPKRRYGRFVIEERIAPLGADSFRRETAVQLVRGDEKQPPDYAAEQPWDAPRRALSKIFSESLGVGAEPIISLPGRQGYQLNPEITWSVDLVDLSDEIEHVMVEYAQDDAARAAALLEASKRFIEPDSHDPRPEQHQHLVRRGDVDDFQAWVLLQAAHAACAAGLPEAADVVEVLLTYGASVPRGSLLAQVADAYVRAAPASLMAQRLQSVGQVVGPESDRSWLNELREIVRISTEKIADAQKFDSRHFKTSGVCRMQEADREDLGVRPARSELRGDDGSFPYIPRTKAAELEEILQTARGQAGLTGVLLHGPEAAGKTRLLFECVSKVWSDSWLIAPRANAPTRVLLPSAHVDIVAGGVHEPVVLWFDALGTLVSPGGQGFTIDDLNAVRRDDPRRPVLIACTYSDRESASTAVEDDVGRNETRRFYEGFHLVGVDSKLDNPEMRDLCELLGPEVGAAIEKADRSLGAFACAKSQLLVRYHRGESDVDRDGHELVEALLAWGRGVTRATVSKDFARRLWAAYRHDIGLAPDADQWSRVWEWAQESVVDHMRLVRWFQDDQGYGPDSVLDGEVNAAHVRRLHQHAPLAELLEEWAQHDPARALDIATLARENGLDDVAEAWFKRAIDEPGVVDADRARAWMALSILHADTGDAGPAGEAREQALNADPLLGDTLDDDTVDLGAFRSEVEKRRLDSVAPPAEVTSLVQELFCDSKLGRVGPFKMLTARTTLIDGALYCYAVEPLDDRGRGTGATHELLVFTNVEGELGGALWDEEVRTLLRLNDRRHPGLPRVLGGGYEPAARIACVVTDAAGRTLDDTEFLKVLRADPARCVRELAELADALSVLHGHRIVHRNLWPGTIERKPLAEEQRRGLGGTLRLGRFEMSAHIDNLIRRAHGSADSRATRARHFYSRQGLHALQYFAPERIDAILGLPSQDAGAAFGDSYTADVFGLGATAYEWFVEPIPTGRFVTPGSSGARLRDQLRALHDHMRSRLTGDKELPCKLRDLLLGMLTRSSSARHTSAEVVHAISDAYDALQAMYEPDAEREPLAAFLLEESTKTIHRWGWAIHDPTTEVGKRELADVIEEDLRGSVLVYSERGALDFVRRSHDAPGRDDRKEAKIVLIGNRGAWFGHIPIDYKAPDQPSLDFLLLIRYVARRHHAEVLLDQPIRRRMSHVRAIAFPTNQRFDAVGEDVVGRPSWRTLQTSVESADELSEKPALFLGAMRWFLDYQSARHRQREYPFVCDDPAGRWASLQWDRERDARRIQRDPLLVALDGKRPSFGEFFTSDDAWTGGYLQIRADEEDRPARIVGDAIEVEWVADGELRIRRAEGALIPPRGWLRPSDSSQNATELRRQSMALAELRYRHGLLEHLVEPYSLGGPIEPWKDVGLRENLRGDGRRLARRMLVDRPFFALHGPPGTGKSTIVALVVEAYLRREPSHRILVAAQANDGLDALAEKVLERIPTDGSRAVVALRLGQERPDRPNDVVDARRLERVTDQMVGDVRDRVAVVLAEMPHDAPLRPIAERWLGEVERSRYELQGRILRGANLVFATCSGSNREALDTGSSFATFDWVIVEEAAKAWPTELAIPLVRGVRWALVGDHLQLPAYRRDDVVETLRSLRGPAGSWNEDLRAIGERADDYERAFSFFGELFKDKQKGDPLESITTQFRMREPIASLVSSAFYEPGGTKLITDPDTERDHEIRAPTILRDSALIWLDTSQAATGESGRWRNVVEARFIDRLLRTMFGGQRGELPPERLAVLTPWHEQRRTLREMLPESMRDAVHTVDSFQGGQAEIVVVSLVRTGRADRVRRRLGLLATPERANVMLSRAKYLLVIVGEFETFAGTGAEKAEEQWPYHWRAVTDEIERQRARVAITSVPELVLSR